MQPKLTLHIVPHTHWDREWYFTVEEYRYRLVKLVDTLLRCMENQSIAWFVLDGQTIAINDYLEVRPENLDRLKRLIQDGRLIIGPWYAQPNTFMSGAEAQVRNLLRGRRAMAGYGGGMRDINYLPDQFGFNSQIPQMTAGFGMTHLVAWRGLPKGCPTYMKWKGSDGTAVMVCALINAYGNAAGLCDRTERKAFTLFGEPGFLPSLPEKLDPVLREQQRAIAPQVLAMNGVDHSFPNTSMAQTIAKIRELHPDVIVQQSNLRNYIDAVEATRTAEPITITGEQRDPREGVILPASQSMRMDVKMRNRRLEDLLTRRIEPLMCLMQSIGETNLPAAQLQRAWDILLENQAHDSLCCSNADPSYREVLTRFDRIDDIGREICSELDQRLLRRIQDLGQEAVLVINPTAEGRDEPMTIELAVASQRSFAEPHLFLGGKEIPAFVQAVRTDTLLRFVPFVGQPAQANVAIFRVTIDPGAIPPMGYKLMEIRGGAAHAPLVEGLGLVTGLRQLENEYLKVTVNADATLDVTDKRTGREYSQVHSFIDNGEAGNGFEHRPPCCDSTEVSSGRDISVSIVENNPLTGILNVSQSFSVPVALAPDRTSRSAQRAHIGICTDVILRRGCPYVEFKTRIHNTAADHRLRVAFPTDSGSTVAYAGQPFDVVLRPIQPENVTHDASDNEQYVGYHPMHDFCGIGDGVAGVTVAGDGIMEYEVLPARRTLCLTLLRATDRLYCGPLANGSKFRLPAAQMPGHHDFRYAFIPYQGALENSLPAVERFRHPLISVQKDFLEDESMPDYQAPPANLPASAGFIRVDGNMVTTSVKPAEDGNGLILRLYNPADRQEALKVSIDSGYDILAAALVRLDETPQSTLSASGNTLEMPVDPKKIISIRLVLQRKAT